MENVQSKWDASNRKLSQTLKQTVDVTGHLYSEYEGYRSFLQSITLYSEYEGYPSFLQSITL